ncbi:MAG: hypothetical protein SGPRY_010157, partial [Prymnesium sp.]
MRHCACSPACHGTCHRRSLLCLKSLRDADDLVVNKLILEVDGSKEVSYFKGTQYCVITKGKLDLKYLKKCGMPLKMATYYMDANEGVIANKIDLWVDNWQQHIAGAHQGDAVPEEELPAFDKDKAFRRSRGKFVSIREEDEEGPAIKINMNGQIIHQRGQVISADFVKAI